MNNASQFRLFAACLYELLLLIALWMLSTLIFVSLFGDATHYSKRYFLQLFLWFVTGAYFVSSWCRTGQTLPAKTWKIKLVNQDNALLTLNQAIIRYALTSASLLACGLGFVWALVDKDRLFLHDRLLKTRFIQLSLS
jgi:uncharacterized RDD family membrane protein YckC